jgi:gamma-butyrobetaine dioxygenase
MTKDLADERTTIRQVDREDDRIVVHWADGHRSPYHFGWLRHSLFFPPFTERKDGLERFGLVGHPDGLVPASVETTGDGNLRVVWGADGRAADYEAAWLRGHCYSAGERKQRRTPIVLWDSSIAEDLPEMSYETARSSDEQRFALYRQVLSHGFALLRDVPLQSAKVVEVGGLFGLVRLSPYGQDNGRYENVQSDPTLNVGTRQSHALGPHTDTCWRLSLSGLVLMHCLKAHDTGGESLLVDGFKACERLRREAPGSFELLRSVPLKFGASVSNGDEYRGFGRLISCDAEGNVIGFRYNENSVRPLELPEDLVQPVYGALADLEAILFDPAMRLQWTLRPGDVIVMDNQRVLHGRSAFDPAGGERQLQHCSVERDVFHNNYRRLARALGREDWDDSLTWGVC